jgi:hypothetical protein
MVLRSGVRMLAVIITVLAALVSPAMKFGIEEETLVNQMRSQLDAVHKVLDDLQAAADLIQEAEGAEQPEGEGKASPSPPLQIEIDPAVSYERDEDPRAADVYLAQEIGDDDFPLWDEEEQVERDKATRKLEKLKAKYAKMKEPELHKQLEIRGLKSSGDKKEDLDKLAGAVEKELMPKENAALEVAGDDGGGDEGSSYEKHRGGAGLKTQEEWQSLARQRVDDRGTTDPAGETTQIAWVLGVHRIVAWLCHSS